MSELHICTEALGMRAAARPTTQRLTFMHIMAKMSRLFWPSDSMPILADCSRPVMPYLHTPTAAAAAALHVRLNST
jgi:hypothetical protein